MPLNIEKLKERYEKKKAAQADRYEFKDGENYIRILPPSLAYLTEEVSYITAEYMCHFNIGAEGSKHSEICPRSFGPKNKCPICEVAAKLYKSNSAEDKALAKDLYQKRRIIYNIIDLKNPEKGIQIMETGPKVYEDLVVFITNPKWGDLLDLDEGRNVSIYRTPGKETKSGYNEFSVTPDPDKCSVRELLPTTWKEDVQRLLKCVPAAKSYEELEAALAGEEVAQVDEADSSHAEVEVTEEAPKTVERKAVDAPKKESPKKALEPEKEAVVEPEKDTTKAPADAKSNGRKPCFGEKYKVSSGECKECGDKVPCRTAFLNV